MIKTWKNGAKGGDVKNIIDYNFSVVSKYLSKDIKTLSTQERKLLSSDYVSENSLVFDTDENRWYKYSNGYWVPTFVDVYTQDISVDDWVDNEINVLFNQHGVENPMVQLSMENGSSFVPVLGGVEVDSKYNVKLSTDLPFSGKVVIK